jgi:cell division septation protein DedD
MPLVWIPATICVGLLIAAVYLGGRILTAHSHAPAAIQIKPAAIHPPAFTPEAPAIPATTAAPAVQAPAEQATAEQAPAVRAPAEQAPADALAQLKAEAPELIAPQAGQRYIQVAALNLDAALRYVGKLRQAKLEPHVAPGPTPELVRVLIGPFVDQDSLTRTKSELESARIDHFIRKY